MFVYLILIGVQIVAITLCCLFKSNRFKAIILFFCCTIFALVVGLRSYVVGIDTSTYLKSYNVFYEGTYNNEQMNYEIGFLAIMKISAACRIPFRVFLLIISFATYFLIGFFCYKTTKHSLVLFYSINCLGVANLVFSATRQMLSLSIMLIGFIPFKFKEKYPKIGFLFCLFFILVASLFHYTALVAFIIPLIKLLKIKKEDFYLMAAIFILVCILSPYLYVVVYRNVGDLSYSYFPDFSNTPLTLIMYILIFAFLLLLDSFEKIPFIQKIFPECEERTWNDSKNFYANSNKYETIALYMFVILILSCSLTGLVFSRFIYYLIPFLILSFTKTVCEVKNKKLSRICLIALIFGCTVYYCYTVLIQDSLKILPYSLGEL